MTASTLGLLVDDDELYLRTLQRSLARKGLETQTAQDAASARRIIGTVDGFGR